MNTSSGKLVTNQHSNVKYFRSKEEALEYENLKDAEVVTAIETFYTAKSQFERFIMTPFGGIIEFSSEKKALRVARYYNDDIVKMKLSASEYKMK